jgi:hypothetical protein
MTSQLLSAASSALCTHQVSLTNMHSVQNVTIKYIKRLQPRETGHLALQSMGTLVLQGSSRQISTCAPGPLVLSIYPSTRVLPESVAGSTLEGAAKPAAPWRLAELSWPQKRPWCGLWRAHRQDNSFRTLPCIYMKPTKTRPCTQPCFHVGIQLRQLLQGC